MYKTTFSIQEHFQKNRIHWDLRILSPIDDRYAWSWAIPKQTFPSVGQRILAKKVEDHDKSYMMFTGYLKNGDYVNLYDRGEVLIHKYLEDRHIVMEFKGKIVKGFFILLHTDKDNWLLIGKKSILS